MKKVLFILSVVIGIAMSTNPAVAQAPRTLSYQGIISQASGAPLTGTHQITVRLYDAPVGGKVVHAEAFTSTIDHGVFSVVLGSGHRIASSVGFDQPYWVGVSIDEGPEMSPRTEFSSVPFAMHADVASGLVAGASGAVTGINGQSGDLEIKGGNGVVIETLGKTVTISAANTSNGNGASPQATSVNQVTGTTNQISASPTTGNVVLSLPQNIHSGASPTFRGMTLTNIGNAGVVHANGAGDLSSSLIDNSDVASNAAIADTKLATITSNGKVANSATTATSSNTSSSIVLRDGSGNFNAGTISATLNGNASNVSGVVVETHGGTGLSSYSRGDMIYASSNNNLAALAIGSSGSVLTVNGNSPSWSSLSSVAATSVRGTNNQVYVNGGTSAQTGAITLSLPQSINTNSDVSFGGLSVDGGTTLTGTTNINTSNGSNTSIGNTGNITLNGRTIDIIGNGANSPNINIGGNGYSDNIVVRGTTVDINSSNSSSNNGPITIGSTGNGGNVNIRANTSGNTITLQAKSIVLNNANSGQLQFSQLNRGVLHSDNSGNITSTQVDLGSNSEVTGTLAESNGGTGQSNYSRGDLLYSSSNNNLARRSIGTNGQVLTVSGGLPVWSALSNSTVTSVAGTNNQVYVNGGTNAQNGDVVLSLPQNIHANASPTFRNLTLSNLNSGVVHTNNNGDLSSSSITNNDIANNANIDYDKLNLTGSITNSDIARNANISDTKLAQISSNGKVANSATTATTSNVGNTIVLRNGAGNFSAGTISADLNGDVNGTATNVSGTVLETHGGTGITSYSRGDIIYASSTNNLSRRSIGNSGQVLTISGGVPVWAALSGVGVTSATGTANQVLVNGDASPDHQGGITLSLPQNINSGASPTFAGMTLSSLSTQGVLHNSAAGVISTSLITDADIASAAAISDTKLALITSAGKVANSATSASTTNDANTIVLRDAAGNFSANLINANITGSAVSVSGLVSESNGGTNQSSYAPGDMLYASATNTLSRLSAGSEGMLLTEGADGLPIWAPLTLSGMTPLSSAVDVVVSNAGQLQTRTVGSFCDTYWARNGNAGTTPGTDYLGTSDNQAFNIGVNGLTAFTFNTNGSIQRNETGDSRGSNATDLQRLRGSDQQVASGSNAVIGGGSSNRASAANSAIGGGDNNTASGSYATVAGGQNNVSDYDYAAVGGGYQNEATYYYSSITGGFMNTSSNFFSFIGGGQSNTADGYNGTIAGGYNNHASADYASVLGGKQNYANAPYTTTGGGYFNRSLADYVTIGGGYNNAANNYYAVIGGGNSNVASGSSSTTSGGILNSSLGDYSTVVGGNSNTANASTSSILGGEGNTTNSGADYSVASGLNAVTSQYGQNTQASGSFTSAGDAQSSVYVERGTTSSTTAVNLALDGGSTELVVPANTTMAFNILVAARDGAGNAATYIVEGNATNVAGTVTVASTFTTGISNGFATGNVSVGATGSTLNITVSDSVGSSTVRWVARITTTEVTF